MGKTKKMNSSNCRAMSKTSKSIKMKADNDESLFNNNNEESNESNMTGNTVSSSFNAKTGK